MYFILRKSILCSEQLFGGVGGGNRQKLYSRISVVRGEHDRVCLELPQSWDYTHYVCDMMGPKRIVLICTAPITFCQNIDIQGSTTVEYQHIGQYNSRISTYRAVQQQNINTQGSTTVEYQHIGQYNSRISTYRAVQQQNINIQGSTTVAYQHTGQYNSRMSTYRAVQQQNINIQGSTTVEYQHIEQYNSRISTYRAVQQQNNHRI